MKSQVVGEGGSELITYSLWDHFQPTYRNGATPEEDAIHGTVFHHHQQHKMKHGVFNGLWLARSRLHFGPQLLKNGCKVHRFRWMLMTFFVGKAGVWIGVRLPFRLFRHMHARYIFTGVV